VTSRSRKADKAPLFVGICGQKMKKADLENEIAQLKRQVAELYELFSMVNERADAAHELANTAYDEATAAGTNLDEHSKEGVWSFPLN
jgi:uncharacterized coiled-coil DUF342 family protein